MFATEGRRQPTLIGKDVSGRRLPGGPYTLWQGVAAVVVLVSAWSGRGLWAGESSPIAVALSCAVLGGLAGFVAGFIDPSKRNIGLQLTGWVPAFCRAVRPNGAALPRGVPRPRRTAPSPAVHVISLPGPVTTAPMTPLAAPTPADAQVDISSLDQHTPAITSTERDLAVPVVETQRTDRVSPLEAFISAGERITTP